MPSPEYQQRQEIFEGHVAAAREVLRYAPESPHHPYLDEFDGYLDSAVLGVIDRNAGLLYADGDITEDTVVMAPVLQADIKGVLAKLNYSVTNHLYNRPGYVPPVSPIGHIDNISAETYWDEGVAGSLILLAPRLEERSTLQRGSTITHELDHVHWARHRELLRGESPYSLRGRALLELSAYELDCQLYQAFEPERYIHVWNQMSQRMQGRNFAEGVAYLARGKDKYMNSMRNTAFITVMFHYLGLEPSVVPSRRGLRAMKHQGLI